MAAGFVAAHQGVAVYVDGTPTSMTNEAMSLVSGKTYKITSAVKQCIDPRQDLTIKDNAVAVAAANILSIDYLQGIVTFQPAYTPTTPITATGTYVPMAQVGFSKSFNVTVTRDKLDKTIFGNLFRRYVLGLADTSGDLGQFSELTTAFGIESFFASLDNGTLRFLSVEILQDGATLGNGGLRFRCLARLESHDTKGSPADIVESGLKFTGTAMVSSNAQVSGTWPVSWSLLDGATNLVI